MPCIVFDRVTTSDGLGSLVSGPSDAIPSPVIPALSRDPAPVELRHTRSVNRGSPSGMTRAVHSNDGPQANVKWGPLKR